MHFNAGRSWFTVKFLLASFFFFKLLLFACECIILSFERLIHYFYFKIHLYVRYKFFCIPVISMECLRFFSIAVFCVYLRTVLSIVHMYVLLLV